MYDKYLCVGLPTRLGLTYLGDKRYIYYIIFKAYTFIYIRYIYVRVYLCGTAQRGTRHQDQRSLGGAKGVYVYIYIYIYRFIYLFIYLNLLIYILYIHSYIYEICMCVCVCVSATHDIKIKDRVHLGRTKGVYVYTLLYIRL